MNGNSGHSGRVELFGNTVGSVFGSTENDCWAHTVDQVGSHRNAIASIDRPEMVVYIGGVLFGDVEFMANRIVLIPLDENVHVAIESGREQNGAAVIRALVEQLAYLRKKAHVGHAVGFVEHNHVNLIEEDHPLVNEVAEATGAGHDNLHAAPKCLSLTTNGNAAKNCLNPWAAGSSQKPQFRTHLSREFPSGNKDEASWTVGGCSIAADDKRYAKRQGLA